MIGYLHRYVILAFPWTALFLCTSFSPPSLMLCRGWGRSCPAFTEEPWVISQAFMWDLWFPEWRFDRFPPSTSVSPCRYLFTKASFFCFTHLSTDALLSKQQAEYLRETNLALPPFSCVFYRFQFFVLFLCVVTRHNSWLLALLLLTLCNILILSTKEVHIVGSIPGGNCDCFLCIMQRKKLIRKLRYLWIFT